MHGHIKAKLPHIDLLRGEPPPPRPAATASFDFLHHSAGLGIHQHHALARINIAILGE